MRTYAVIEAPSDLGLKPSGPAGLPRALREAGLLDGLAVRHEARVAVPPHDRQRDAATGFATRTG
jgi:arginase